MVLAAVYGGLALVYLAIMPVATILYVNARWYDSSGWEKIFMFFLAFFFFPGIIVFGPFLNVRPQRRAS